MRYRYCKICLKGFIWVFFLHFSNRTTGIVKQEIALAWANTLHSFTVWHPSYIQWLQSSF